MKSPIILGAIALLGLIVLRDATFVIDQSEQAILVQFGEPIGEPINEPGLHFKTPFVQEVRRFDKRLLAWDGDVSQIPTLGREFVIVDTTARWRISDPLQFLRSVRDESGARTRLDDIIDSVARDIVSGTDLEEIVRSRDWQVDVKEVEDEAVLRGDVDLEKPKKGRERLEQEMLTAASRLMPELGIELVDVRIKRINYIESVRRQVETRMISERQSIAERFRSEGQGKSQEILGDMERQLRTIRSEAERQFYAFFRTLESYRNLGENSTLMLDSDSDFFRYLQSTRRR
jgi:membrane protease subunit HflC